MFSALAGVAYLSAGKRSITDKMNQPEESDQSQANQRRRGAGCAAKIIAAFLGIGLAWLMLELLMRVAFPLFPYTIQAALREVRRTPFTEERILPQQIWQEDIHYQFVSRSNVNNEYQFPDPRVGFYVTTKNWLDPNSHVGFRVPSADWEPRWPIDAVIVGDSFSFCYTEYPDCWVQRLDSEHGMSVVNLGQVATGSISHLNILTTFGLPHQPRMVIWQWYGNDFNDDYGMALMNDQISAVETPEAPQLVPPSPPSSSILVEWLEKNSAVYWIIKTVTTPKPDLYKYQRFVDPYMANDGEIAFSYGRSYTSRASDLSAEKNQIGLELSMGKILETHELLASQDIKLVILLIPSKEEVYRRWTEPTLGNEQLDLLSQGRLEMIALCEVAKLLCLDSTPALTAAAEQQTAVYLPFDTHLNVAGNQIVTDELWQFLTDNQLSQ